MRKYLFLVLSFLLIAGSADAASVGEKRTFNIDPSYDVIDRKEVYGVLQKIGSRAYYYIDDNWWETLNYTEQANVKSALTSLSEEFDNNIYPKVTEEFGYEPKPGIDGDNKTTILLHPMKDSYAGYYNSGNQYTKIQNPKSNEREMIYLGSDFLSDSRVKSFLAHEFLHLITFNQKEKIHNIAEEVWLNEARADYIPTFLGYDDNYQRSNLKNRVDLFYNNPNDSLTEWQGKNHDYGVANLFIQYLVDHYGVAILSDSLKLDSVGIESINLALEQNGFDVVFSEIFTDWTIASLVNNCSLGEKYCYKNPRLTDFRINSVLNFLPLNGESVLAVSQNAKNWETNWIKVVGGSGTIQIDFIGNPSNKFEVPYVILDKSGNYLIKSFHLDNDQKGQIVIDGFGSSVNSLIMIPSIQTKMSGFSNNEESIPFFWQASVIKQAPIAEDHADQEPREEPEEETDQLTKEQLMSQIEQLQALVRQLVAQLAALTSATDQPKTTNSSACPAISVNLSFGEKNDSVVCLQEFLKSRGPDIYPEGLVTGYFGNLTKSAVIRFQEKYANDILAPFGLIAGNGFVGPKTREKINQLLK